MIFYGIFENIWHSEHSRGSKHLATRVQGAPTLTGRAPCLVGPRWLPSTYSCTHTLHLLPKKSPSSSSTSSSPFCCDFRSPCSKLHLENCFGRLFLGMDSSNGPISFFSSALFIANFCCIGDPVLELACQIYEVPSNSNA